MSEPIRHHVVRVEFGHDPEDGTKSRLILEDGSEVVGLISLECRARFNKYTTFMAEGHLYTSETEGEDQP